MAGAIVIAVAKKPGRPKGSTNKTTKEVIVKIPGKRGRKPGSKNKPKLSLVETLPVEAVDIIAASGTIPANDAEMAEPVELDAAPEEVVEAIEVADPEEVVMERVTAGLDAVCDIKSALKTAKLNKKHMPVNHAEAEKFLTLLDEEAEYFVFQTFDDNQDRKDKSLGKILIGTYEEHAPQLTELNSRGAGIFVTVNRTNSNGRTIADMLEPRVLFNEDDCGTSPSPAGLEAHIVVVSSPGKKHDYYLIDGATAADWPTWDGCQLAMALEYGSDKNAVDRTRVLRLPGYYHQKNPRKPHLVYIRSTSGEQPYTMAQIAQCVPPKAPKAIQRPAVPGNSEHLPEIESALEFIDPDCGYKDWTEVGMAIHHETNGGGNGLDSWIKWSSGDLSADHHGVKYPAKNPDLLICKWNSFNSNGNKTGAKTRASIFKMAQDAGWINPKKKQSSANAEPPPHSEKTGAGQPAGNDTEKEEQGDFKIVPIADVFTNPQKPRKNYWADRVPANSVTLLAAHGGVGKSTFELQMAVFKSLGVSFLGFDDGEPTRTLFFSAEDCTETIRLRVADICKAHGFNPAEVAKNLTVMDATDCPCLFEEAHMGGGVKRGQPTDEYDKLKKFIAVEGIQLLIVDNASDTYAANPIDRQAVTAYIRSLTRLVRPTGGAVILLAHVPKTVSRAGAKQTDTEGYADSAAWNNACRSRLFLNADTNGGLVLSHQKNNYGKTQPDLNLRFREDGGGMELLNAGHAVDMEINKSALLALKREPVLKLIHEFYGREEWINPSSRSTSNVHAMLKAETCFPFGKSRSDKDDCLAMIRDCERDELIVKEVYRKPDRHDGERWAVSEKGLNLINSDSEKS